MSVEENRPLAIIAGTGVPEEISLRQLVVRLLPREIRLLLEALLTLLAVDLRPLHRHTRVRVGSALYWQFVRLSRRSKVFGLKQLGIWSHSEESYAELRPRLLRFALGRQDLDFDQLSKEEVVSLAAGKRIDVLGDSQGGFPAVRFAEDFPELVAELILLSVPLDGTPAAQVVDTAGTRCMRQQSRYVKRIRGGIRRILSATDGPRVTCISSGHDYLVPHQSAFYRDPRVRCICLSHTSHETLHDLVELVKVGDGRLRMHISEVFLRGTGEVVRRVRQGDRPHPATKPPRVVARRQAA